MRYIDEFRDSGLARRLLDDIARSLTRPWSLMEVCGGQTHSIIRHGIDQMLPDGIELIHGPGCPVCVTPLNVIDKALDIAARSDVVFCSFGDMLRVPGSHRDLFRVKSAVRGRAGASEGAAGRPASDGWWRSPLPRARPPATHWRQACAANTAATRSRCTSSTASVSTTSPVLRTGSR